MLFKTWFSKTSNSYDSNDTKGHPYHASTAAKPPVTGLFPYAGNGDSRKTSNFRIKFRHAPSSSSFTTSGDAGRLVDTFKLYKASRTNSQGSNYKERNTQKTEIIERYEAFSSHTRCDPSCMSKEREISSTKKPISIDVLDAQSAIRRLFFTELFDSRTTLLSTKEMSRELCCTKVTPSYGENVADRNMIRDQERYIRRSEESVVHGISEISRVKENYHAPESDPTASIADNTDSVIHENISYHENVDERQQEKVFRQKASSFSHNIRSFLVNQEVDCRRPKSSTISSPNFSSTVSALKGKRTRSHSKTSFSLGMKKNLIDLNDVKLEKTWPIRTSSLSPTSMDLSKQNKTIDIVSVVDTDEISSSFTCMPGTSNFKVMETNLPAQESPKDGVRPTIKVIHEDSPSYSSNAGAQILPKNSNAHIDSLEHTSEDSRHSHQPRRFPSSVSLPEKESKPKLSRRSLSESPSDKILTLRRTRSAILDSESRLKRSRSSSTDISPHNGLSPKRPQSSPADSPTENKIDNDFELPSTKLIHEENPDQYKQSSDGYLPIKYIPNLSDILNSEAAEAPVIPLCNQETSRRRTLNFYRNSTIVSKISSKNRQKRNTCGLGKKTCYFDKEPAYDDSLKWIQIIRSNGVPSIRSASPLPEEYSSDEDSSDPEDRGLSMADGEDLLFRLQGYGTNGALPGLRVQRISFSIP